MPTFMPAIHSYRFGKMVINNETVTSDLMIFSDGRIQKNWRRKRGHFLGYGDIKSLFEPCGNRHPEMFIAGTGAFGMMKIDPELKSLIENKSDRSEEKKNIVLVHQKTSKAIDTYQRAVQEGKTVCACFHLTC